MMQGRNPSLSASTVAALAAMLLAPGARAQTSAPAAAQAAADASAPKVAGKDVAVPTRRKYVAPEYPAEAAAAGTRGIVILEVLIDENGRVEGARVTRSIPGLDEAAIAAVRMWEYEASKLGGKPVKVLLSQSITFALRLPEVQREPGIPELKSGGSPPIPGTLTSPEVAALNISLGSQGEVREASILSGNPALGEALLRAVKLWRFAVAEDAGPLTFVLQADWKPGTAQPLVMRATGPKFGGLATASASSATPTPATAPGDPKAQTASPGPTAPAIAPTPKAPIVETEIIPARPEPPAKEEGGSAITDVVLGENIPDLVRGRRPVWPPLARLGNATGEVVVRFSVDLAGKVTVHTAEGPELLKGAAEQAVATWIFRRTAIDRVHLIATFKYTPERASARVERAKES